MMVPVNWIVWTLTVGQEQPCDRFAQEARSGHPNCPAALCETSVMEDKMRNKRFAVYPRVGVLVLICAASIWTIRGRATTLPTTIADIAGTYGLTKRVMSNGEEIRPPAIVALYTLDHGPHS